MLRDAELFRSRLSKLDGATDIGDNIVDIVNSKVVPERIVPAESEASSTEAAPEEPEGEEGQT